MYLRQVSALAARRATVGSTRRLATGKDVKFGVEGRALMLQGVDKLADAVQVRARSTSIVAYGQSCTLASFSSSLSLSLFRFVFWRMDPNDLPRALQLRVWFSVRRFAARKCTCTPEAGGRGFTRLGARGILCLALVCSSQSLLNVRVLVVSW